MNLHFQHPIDNLIQEDDPVGQAIAAFCSAAAHLKDIAIIPQYRDRMANENDFEHVSHALLQAQLVASLIQCRMIANVECE